MTSRDFCYWLQGFFELDGAGDTVATGNPGLSPKQTAAVRAHLALVFKHEIDPSAGGPDAQAALNKIHEAGKATGPTIGGHGLDGTIYRC